MPPRVRRHNLSRKQLDQLEAERESERGPAADAVKPNEDSQPNDSDAADPDSDSEEDAERCAVCGVKLKTLALNSREPAFLCSWRKNQADMEVVCAGKCWPLVAASSSSYHSSNTNFKFNSESDSSDGQRNNNSVNSREDLKASNTKGQSNTNRASKKQGTSNSNNNIDKSSSTKSKSKSGHTQTVGCSNFGCNGTPEEGLGNPHYVYGGVWTPGKG